MNSVIVIWHNEILSRGEIHFVSDGVYRKIDAYIQTLLIVEESNDSKQDESDSSEINKGQ